MECLIKNVNDTIKRIAEWFRATLRKLSDFLERKEEERREKEIERLMTKLYRLNAVWRVSTDDLTYVQWVLKNRNQEFIWEVGYKHKYLFGRDD